MMSAFSNQPGLFDTSPPPWELEDEGNAKVASIVFSEAPHGPFDYLVPQKLTAEVVPGIRVRVPFARRRITKIGWCVGVAAHHGDPSKLREVESVADREPLCAEHLIDLARWIGEYYHSPLGVVLDAFIPSAVRTKAGVKEQLICLLAPQASELLAGAAAGEGGINNLSAKQRRVLQEAADNPTGLTIRDLAAKADCTDAPIRSLIKRGLLKTERREIDQAELAAASSLPADRGHTTTAISKLSAEQQKSVEAIESAVAQKTFKAFLLHGVTGSGKTEVYMRAIDRAVSCGRTAIVLVPEISLTPQLLAQFESRFHHVMVLHSQMTPAERYFKWQQIRRDKIDIVIGPRSALFAPLTQLGLIVIDEEHDPSFKQNTQPRYHARRAAYELAKSLGIPIVLGSATPSMESYYAAKSGQIELLSMPYRIASRPLPRVRLVDLRSKEEAGIGVLSRSLVQGVQRAIKANGQVLLLLNRRGFSTQIQCPACGTVVACPRCDLPLTHHREGIKAICHYCDYTITSPANCPSCGCSAIRYLGVGTQKLEAEIMNAFPGVEMARMDSDTMRKSGNCERVLAEFRDGKIKVLLGTQMIAKGLDFPNVLLVGVINADTTLHFPDFRAAERTFQLVTQVAGRAGRGDRPGEVIVQTYSPEHFAIVSAAAHDYVDFYNQELVQRQKMSYPPFTKLARVLLRGGSQPITEACADSLKEKLEGMVEKIGADIRILGPATPPIPKLKNMFRSHIILFSRQSNALQKVIDYACAASDKLHQNKVELIVDVDPIDML